jgi:hypothetical protein
LIQKEVQSIYFTLLEWTEPSFVIIEERDFVESHLRPQ